MALYLPHPFRSALEEVAVLSFPYILELVLFSMPEFPSIKSMKIPIKKVAQAAENAFFNHERGGKIDEAWRVLADPDAGNFFRTQAIFAIIRNFMPDAVFEKLTGRQYAYQHDVLPIDPGKYVFDEKVIGGGAECNVYRLNSLDPVLPSLVIKIDQCITRSTDTLLDRARVVRAEYEEKKEWYRELPTLIPDEYHYIGRSPRGGKKALFTIQEFLGSTDEMADIFRGVSREELLRVLRMNSRLATDFRKFVEITAWHAREKNEMIDTIGERNLALVEGRSDIWMILLDPHLTKHPFADTKESKKIQADLEYLESIVVSLDTPLAS